MATATPIVVQRETNEYRAITVTQQGVVYAGAWSYQIVAWGARPTGSWILATTRGATKGVIITGLTAGYYQIYPRPDDADPDVPVLDPIPLIVA